MGDLLSVVVTRIHTQCERVTASRSFFGGVPRELQDPLPEALVIERELCAGLDGIIRGSDAQPPRLRARGPPAAVLVVRGHRTFDVDQQGTGLRALRHRAGWVDGREP